MSPADWTRGPVIHPLHAILLAFPVALFAGALAADIAYLNTAVIQWSNFSGWLLTGALLFGAPVLAWAAADAIFRRRTGSSRAVAYLMLVALMWTAGLVNAFQHSRDGWSSVGALGVTLSVVSAVTALAAAWIAHTGQTVSEGPR